MDLLHKLIDIFLHLDQHLGAIIHQYNNWTYLILFLILFCETGLIVTPFLPGDSLLFAIGAFAARGELNLGVLLGLLVFGPIIGNTVNYSVGHFMGPELLKKGKLPFIKQEHLDRTHKFYEKYGRKTIILAQFVPIVRTFSPFLAGVGSMTYPVFMMFNIAGAMLWVFSLTLAGYFLGSFPFVKEHFEVIVIAIVCISLLPILIEYLKHRHEQKTIARTGQPAAMVKTPAPAEASED